MHRFKTGSCTRQARVQLGLIGGSITYPVVMEVKARRAREYAIQLMALEYTFSQDIQFVYGHIEKP